MKKIEIDEEIIKMLRNLAHCALKGVGLEAYDVVKQMDAWVGKSLEEKAPDPNPQPTVQE